MAEAAPLNFDDTATAFAAHSDVSLKKKYLLFASMNNPALTRFGTGFLKMAFKFGLPVKGAVKQTIFEQFCGGETIKDSEATIQELAEFNIGTILDYSVEGESNEASFDATTEELLRTVAKSKESADVPFCVFKVTGIASFSLLAKIQAKKPLTPTEEEAWQRVQNRVDRICKATYEANTRVLIDGEETWIQDTIDELAYSMIKKYNTERAVVYNTYQMYRTEGMKLLRDGFHFATMHNVWLGAKLVRGAYMEKERARAEEMGYADPINPTKEATDDMYNQGLKFSLDNKQRIAICSGSHNEYSNRLLALLMEKHGVTKNDDRFFRSTNTQKSQIS